jgi:hypothetical protein
VHLRSDGLPRGSFSSDGLPLHIALAVQNQTKLPGGDNHSDGLPGSPNRCAGLPHGDLRSDGLPGSSSRLHVGKFRSGGRCCPPDQLLQLHKALGAPGPRCQGRHAHLRRDGLPGGHIRSDGLT